MQQQGLRGKLFILALLLLLLASYGSNDMQIASGAEELSGAQSTGRALVAQAIITPKITASPTQQAPGGNEYVALKDDTGALYVEVPASWIDVDTSPLKNDQGQVFAASIIASPDIASFSETYDVPGIHLIAFRVPNESVGVDDLLDEIDFRACTYDNRYDYQDNLYTGKYDLYTDCGGQGTTMTVVAAMPPEGGLMTLVVIQSPTEADLMAAKHMLDTFQVVGELPAGQGSNLMIGQN